MHFAGLAAGYLAGCLVYLPILIPWSVQRLIEVYQNWPSVDFASMKLTGPAIMALSHGLVWVLMGSMIADYKVSHQKTGVWSFISPGFYVFGVMAILGLVFGILDEQAWPVAGFMTIGLAVSLVLCLSLYAYWWMAVRVPSHILAQWESQLQQPNTSLNLEDN